MGEILHFYTAEDIDLWRNCSAASFGVTLDGGASVFDRHIRWIIDLGFLLRLVPPFLQNGGCVVVEGALAMPLCAFSWPVGIDGDEQINIWTDNGLFRYAACVRSHYLSFKKVSLFFLLISRRRLLSDVLNTLTGIQMGRSKVCVQHRLRRHR